MATERCEEKNCNGVARFTCSKCGKKLCDMCSKTEYVPYQIHVCSTCAVKKET